MNALTGLTSSITSPQEGLFSRQTNERDSLEELVNSLLADPAQLPEIIETLLTKTDPFSDCVKFLNLLVVLDSEDHLNEIACRFVCDLPVSFIVKILEEHPFIFVSLIERSTLQQTRDLLKSTVDQVGDWKVLFRNIFQILDKNGIDSPMTSRAGHFVSVELGCLSNRRYIQFIKFCTKTLPLNDWAFFILTLNQEKRAFALNVYLHAYSLDLSPEGLLPCCEVFAQQVADPDLIKSVFNHILKKFYRKKEFSVVIDQFDQLSVKAQICFLDAMSNNKIEKVFKHYRKDLPLMAFWMNGLFHHRPSFIQRKHMIEQICDFLPKGKLSEFLAILNAQGSQVGSYFLICLSEEDFQEFIFSVPYTLRSELLSNSIDDATKKQLLLAIKSIPHPSMITEVMTLDMDNSGIPVDPLFPLTLRSCFETMQQAILTKELLDDYASFVTRIPPVLMGVLSLTSSNRKVLLQLAKYFTEEQIKFFITPFMHNETCTAIESIWPYLDKRRFKVLLEALSSDQLSHYVKYKIEKLKEIYKEFSSKLKTLQKALEAIKKEDGVTFATYEDLEKQARNLYRLVCRTDSLDYQLLCNCLQDSQMSHEVDEESRKTLQQTIERFHHKRILLEGKQALITSQLCEIEKLIVDRNMQEEDDLTFILYEGFWTFIREGTLPYLGIGPNSSLGITHAGQLTLLGIRNNQDLCYLGISEEAQRRVEKLFRSIECLWEFASSIPSEKEPTERGTKRLKFKISYESFIDIKIEDHQFAPFCHEFIQVLKLDSRNFHRTKDICLDFCKQLIGTQHIHESDKKNLIKLVEELCSCEIAENGLRLSLHLLEESLLELRRQHPLFCLQRYLCVNKELKNTWQKFHLLECNSISSLFEKGIVKTFTDLLQLEEAIKNLKLA